MAWDITGWMVPLTFWVFVGAVILVPQYLRSRDRQKLYDTIRVAYEKGQPLAPEVVAAMKSATPPYAGIPSAERDLRMGIILLAAGFGMCGLGYGLWYGLTTVDEMAAWSSGGWVGGIGAIVGLIGLIYLGFWLARRKSGPAIVGPRT